MKMKKTFATLLLTSATFFGIQNISAQETTINAAESTIHWLGKKVTGQHEGNISLVSGKLEMEGDVLTGGSFTVDMSSMTVTDIQGEYAEKLKGHLKSDDFTIMRHNALGPESWAPLLASITGDIPDLPQDIRQNAASQLTDILATWPHALPRGFIHADLFPNNALFVKDKLTGIIDFYFGCHDILAYDLAVLLNSWCFDADGSFNVTKSSTILSAYQEQRLLSNAEKQALPLLCRGAAMRFFLTRLYDWINTPTDAMVKPLNPMEYYAKLRFHDTAPGPEAYGLWS